MAPSAKTDRHDGDEFRALADIFTSGLQSIRDRVDAVGDSLGARITGLELRLERLSTESRSHGRGIDALRTEFSEHKRDDDMATRVALSTANGAAVSSPVPDDPGRRLFTVTIDDFRGFLRVLPYLIAIGAGIAGGVYGVTGSGDPASPGKMTVPRFAVPEPVDDSDEPKK